MEQDLDTNVSQKDPKFLLEGYAQPTSHQTIPCLWTSTSWYPLSLVPFLETTIHILRDCPWVKEIWSQSLGLLPLSFFRMPLQDWLRCNATKNDVIMPHQLPWHVYFTFTCWNIWLAHNERIFRDQSRS